MRAPRLRVAPVLATLFVVAGLGLMIASLRIEVVSGRAVDAASARVVVPTATAAAVVAAPGASDERAVRLFERTDEATRTVAFSGVKVVSHWHQGVETSRVVTVHNVPGRGTMIAAGDTADESPVHEFTAPTGDDTAETTLKALVTNYRLDQVGSARTAGRSATTLEATRADGSVAARFWVDEKTGLLLRRVLFDASGTKTESTAFLRIDVTGPTPAATAAASAPIEVEPWQEVDDARLSDLRAQGWPVPDRLAGGLVLAQVRQQSGDDDEVLQLGYTDGLVAVSVFLQAGQLDRDALEEYVAVKVDGGEVWTRSTGSPFSVWQARTEEVRSRAADGTVLSSGDLVVSATTDSVSAPLGSVVAAWPAAAPRSGGVGEHVTRGVQRVTRWFDPMD